MIDVAIPLISALASGALKSVLLQELGERASDAKEQYKRLPATREDATEHKRLECLAKLQKIRNRVTLCGCTRDFQQGVLCLVMEQTIIAYEATNVKSLDLVLMTTDQLETALDAEEQQAIQRNRARTIGVAVSLISLIAIGCLVAVANWHGFDGQKALPLLGIPSCVIFWSAIGSFAAILYRFTNAADTELQDPIRWLYSRPLTGVIMGAIAYLVLKAGLLVITQQPSAANAGLTQTNEVVWLMAFLAGFSDRFSDSLLRSLVGKFGGDKASELVSVASTTKSVSMDLLSTLRMRRGAEKAAPSAVIANPQPVNGAVASEQTSTIATVTST